MKRQHSIIFLCVVVTVTVMLWGQAGRPAYGQDSATPTAPYVGLTPLFPSNTPGSGVIGMTPLVRPSETPTPSITPTPSNTPTPTPSPTPTVPLLTPTPVAVTSSATYVNPTADFTTPEGWSCGDFPCEDDITGFLQRLRVPRGYAVEHLGRLPGQPQQIVYGPDGLLYATTLTDLVARTGEVYRLLPDGRAEQVGPSFVSPIGLDFRPGTDELFVSARVTLETGGGVWRIDPDGSATAIVEELPCCYSVIDNQPNGLVFGPDGYLYVGVGALTDRAEPENPRVQQFADLNPLEASVLRIHPHTGEIMVFAQGIRNPFDLAFAPDGQLYATDNGLITGPGDRLLAIEPGGHYGWPYWRFRGCETCPLVRRGINVLPDLLRFPDYTLPRGLVVYRGEQFPGNLVGSIFVALWHNTPNAQRIVRIDPADIPTEPEALATYEPEPFVTGLVRPIDVTIDPTGALVVVDSIYGHVWRVTYTGETQTEPAPTEAAGSADNPGFITSTPRPNNGP